MPSGELYEHKVSQWQTLRAEGIGDAACARLCGFSRATYYRCKKRLEELKQGKMPPTRAPKQTNKPNKTSPSQSSRKTQHMERKESPSSSSATTTQPSPSARRTNHHPPATARRYPKISLCPKSQALAPPLYKRSKKMVIPGLQIHPDRRANPNRLNEPNPKRTQAPSVPGMGQKNQTRLCQCLLKQSRGIVTIEGLSADRGKRKYDHPRELRQTTGQSSMPSKAGKDLSGIDACLPKEFRSSRLARGRRLRSTGRLRIGNFSLARRERQYGG